MCTNSRTSAEKEVIVPREDNEYFVPDVRLSFRFDQEFDDRALPVAAMSNSVQFMFDWRDGSSIGSNLISEPHGVVATLSVSKRDPVPGLLGIDAEEEEGGYLEGFKESNQDLHGLSLKTNRQLEVEGFPEEKLLIEKSDHPSFYIHCEPSGNDYPSFCTMRWQDFLPVADDSNASVLAEMTFREEDLPQWREIKHTAAKIISERAQVVPRN